MVAHAFDRLSRNQNHQGFVLTTLKSAGAALHLVTEKLEDSATGQFMLAAAGYAAQLEREKTPERTSRGKMSRVKPRGALLPGERPTLRLYLDG